MNYRYRCKITSSGTVPGYLGEDERKNESVIVPCLKSDLSLDEQISIFGKYTKSAFKIHLRGTWYDISEIEFEGMRRNIFGLRHHKNSTVVIVS